VPNAAMMRVAEGVGSDMVSPIRVGLRRSDAEVRYVCGSRRG
jgi:hypothetical protein